MDIFSIISLLGGFTFFIFGMQVMSDNLEKLSGGRLEALLQKVTSKPIFSILLGAIITIAMQSSSASTVMMVGLVNSGIMKFSQTIYVIFGANIGTTLTAWILSLSSIEGESILIQLLKPANFAPIFAFVGILFVMLSKNDKKTSIGTIFVGFSILIFGMNTMSSAMKPLAEMPGFASLLVKFNNPLVAILIGAVFTGLIQSSAASVAILQALAMSGSIPYSIAIFIVMGQNIGTCVTALISCIGTTTNAKRVAIVHIALNTITTILCTIIIMIANAIFSMPILDQNATAAGIAFVHTLFNIVMVIALAPFAKHICRLVELLVKDKKGGLTFATDGISLDERLLVNPSVAIAESNKVTAKMAQLAMHNIEFAESLFDDYTELTEKLVLQTEDELDMCEDRLGSYLVKLASHSTLQKDSRTISKMLHVIGDFERLGDHAVNLMYVAKELHDKNIVFSSTLDSELKVLRSAINEILGMATSCYIENDIEKAIMVEPLEEVIDGLATRIKSNQITLLQKGNSTIEMGFILSDLLNNYERISDHCSNIAVAVIEVEHDSFDTHKYLNGVKFGNSDFNSVYDSFNEKYNIPEI